MSRQIASALILTALMLLPACGGQRAGADAPQAGTSGISSAEGAPAGDDAQAFDPATFEPGAEAAPPMFDPETPIAAASDATVPGPLGMGIWEADGEATLLIGTAASEPVELLTGVKVRMHLESRQSERGHEILVWVRTPQPKAEGGVLYLTASTAGGGSNPAIAADFINVEEDTNGIWHYGVNQAPTAAGLINLLDLTELLKAEAIPENLPPDLLIDQFEGALTKEGGFIITGAGALPNDDRRVVFTARATGDPEVQQAIAAAPPAAD